MVLLHQLFMKKRRPREGTKTRYREFATVSTTVNEKKKTPRGDENVLYVIFSSVPTSDEKKKTPRGDENVSGDLG